MNLCLKKLKIAVNSMKKIKKLSHHTWSSEKKPYNYIPIV